MKAKLATRALIALFVFVNALICVNAQTAPSISQQPQGQSVVVGTNVSFAVVADGSAPMNYQWYRSGNTVLDDSHVSGSTNAVLSMNPVNSGDGGNYTVVITNAWGSITSAVANLNVLIPPAITTQPLSCSYPSGVSVTFVVTAAGSTPRYYKWQLNGSSINDATNSIYVTAPLTESDLGTYSVVVSNAAGAVTSSDALLTFGPVACWGPTGAASSPPPNLTNVTAIAGGAQFSCSLQNDGTIVVWGNTNHPGPNVSNAVAVAAAANNSGLVLLSDGTAIGWGGASVPPNATNIAAIAVGTSSLFLRNDGTVLSAPDAAPAGLANISAISAGAYQNLAMRSDGTVVAWRANGIGGGATNVPPSLHDTVGIGSGCGHALALTSDGHIVAWRGTMVRTTSTNIPAQLVGPNATPATAIAAGGFPGTASVPTSSSVALLTNGTVVAWGDGVITNVPSGLSNVAAVAVGGGPALALVNDGRPLILQSPVGGTWFKGQTAHLVSHVTGNAPLTYQWLLNGTNLPEATNATLELSNFDAFNAGTYQLLITNQLGTATSLPLPVGMLDGPLYISSQPASSTNYLGRRVHLGGSVGGSRPMQLQWRYSPSSPPVWQDIPGATNEDLVLDPLRAANAGIYSFVASNGFGSLTSSNAVLGVKQVFVAGDTSNNKTNVPANLTNAIAITTGNMWNLMALRDDGTALSWGRSGSNSFPTMSNLVEVACADTQFMGLRNDGRPFGFGYFTFQMSNALAGMSNIVAIEADSSGARCLRADGTVLELNVDGPAFVRATNVVAIGSFSGNSCYFIYGDGRASYRYVSGAGPFQAITNAITVGGGPLTSSVVLRRDGTIVTFGGTNQPTSNVVGVTGTDKGLLFAISSDGTVTNWGASSFAGFTPLPVDLYAPSSIVAGNDHIAVMYSSTSLPAMLLPRALDIDATVVSSENSAKWYGQTNISHDGNHAARSAEIGSNTASSMRMLITNGPVTVSYWWKVSSETNHDLLTFAIGGIPQTSISGEVDWQQATFTVPAGPQMLVWTYSKDGSGAAGLDAGFVDQLTITPIAPSITAQPTNNSVNPGSNALFAVTATGTAPLTYNWLFNGTPIVGATNRTYTITNAQPTSVGTYSVIVTSGVGAVTSSDATLALNQPPSIDLQPQSQTIISGNNTTLSVTATGTAPLFYQWQFNSAPIAGATNSSLSFSPAQQTDAGSYTVTVSNMAGSVTSTTATLVVYDPVVIASQPQSQTLSQNTAVSFSIDATGTTPLQYQWRFNGIDITDATNTSYSLSSAQITNSGSYSVVVTNIANSLTSADAVLVVNPCAIHVIDVSTDTNATINITWSADPAITYTIQSKPDLTNSQWSSVATSNAASTTLTFSDTATNSQQFYRLISDCTASETCGFIRLDLPGNSDTVVSMPFGRPVAAEPYWTLNAIFPNGAGINTSPTLGNRNTEILMPDLLGTGINLSATKIYFFHGGIWKQVGQGNVDHGTDTIAPNTWFIVRHNVATNTTLIAAGIVDQSRQTITLRTDNSNNLDNVVALMRPVTLSLNDSELISSGAFSPSALPGARTDELLNFDNTTIAKNKSASGVYYYWSNAWRRVGSGTADFGSEKVFSPGTGVIIRKFPASTNAIWTNSPSY